MPFRKVRLITILFMIMLVLFAGCDLSMSDFLDVDTGDLLIRFGLDRQPRTLLPELSMAISSYTISGIGPQGKTFTASHTGTDDFLRTNLVAGEWIITIQAYNEDTEPVLVGEGSATIFVMAGRVEEAAIDIIPVSGSGGVEITLSWEAVLSSAWLHCVVRDSDDVAVETMDIPEISGQEITITVDDVPTGYFLLEVTLMDDQVSVGNAVEAFRVVDGVFTYGNIVIPTESMPEVM